MTKQGWMWIVVGMLLALGVFGLSVVAEFGRYLVHWLLGTT